MSCSRSELTDYFFGELPAAQRAVLEDHLETCPACRDELASLSETRVLLCSVAEQEPPRRIAFVSDKVFEPRWWQRIWNSGPRLGFASAAVLAGAVVIHGFAYRPAAPQAALSARVSLEDVNAEVDRRVKAEVATAIAESEAKQTREVLEIVNARLKQAKDSSRLQRVLMEDYLERMDKRNTLVVKRAVYE